MSDIVTEPSAPHEERFVIPAMSWQAYVALRDSLDESGSHLRLTYLHGVLELMSPSTQHEEMKSLLGRLLESWCVDHDIEIFLHGSTTLREERARAGLEADESYSFGQRKDIPDLAIEVVWSAWRVDKLEVYRGLGVREVWVFRDGTIEVHVLSAHGYETRTKSAVLPALDLAVLARHVVPGKSLSATLKEFRRAIG